MTSPKPPRREFLALTGAVVAGGYLPAWSRGTEAPAGIVLLDSGRFDDLGGWVPDQQSMDQMGSTSLHADAPPIKFGLPSISNLYPLK